MSVAIVTGSSGLIGSETAKFLDARGLHVVGIDNDMRRYFFGEDGSTEWNTRLLQSTLKNFEHHAADVRDAEAVGKIFETYGPAVSLVVHTAARPSRARAARRCGRRARPRARSARKSSRPPRRRARPRGGARSP